MFNSQGSYTTKIKTHRLVFCKTDYIIQYQYKFFTNQVYDTLPLSTYTRVSYYIQYNFVFRYVRKVAKRDY
jgi:hypothetical protein